MAGHSKWAQIKRKKAVTDARRGKLWTKLLKEVTVAARMGGGDPGGNPRLRTGIADAKAANVPNDNIDRAIQRGTGDLEGVAYEELTYEGYGPGGVAILIETVTDNKNRTVSEFRHLFSRNEGNLGENGCVAWMFEKKGVFTIPKESFGEDRLMEIAMEIGATDFDSEGDEYELYSAPEDFAATRESLEAMDVPVSSSQLAMEPQSTVEVAPEQATLVLRLLEALEDHDDAQNVWSNVEFDEELVEA